jgi:hypothetical protein
MKQNACLRIGIVADDLTSAMKTGGFGSPSALLDAASDLLTKPFSRKALTDDRR